MVRDKLESLKRKIKGQDFQQRVLRKMLDKATSIDETFKEGSDISSCVSCGHGEDIWLSDKLRNLFPVSTECKFRTEDHKTIRQHYTQAVRQTNQLARTDNIIPHVVINHGVGSALSVINLDHLLDLLATNHLLKSKIKEQTE